MSKLISYVLLDGVRVSPAVDSPKNTADVAQMNLGILFIKISSMIRASEDEKQS